jgi:uncharacterized protein (DUF58 family)
VEQLATQRSHSTLTTVGRFYAIVLAFVLGGALIRDINLLLIVAGVMLGPLVLGWRIVREITRNVKVNRSLPAEISAGDMIHVQISISNGLRSRPVWGISVVDHLRKTRPGTASELRQITLLFPYIAGRTSAVEAYTARLLERGCYEFGPLIVKTQFPMGLVESTLIAAEKRELIVQPRIGTLSPQWTRALTPMQIGTRTQRGQHTQSEGEFHSLRDFRVGDSRRWIHWRSSAKRRKLTVRQFQRWQNHDLAVIVELPANEPLTELAIRFVATLGRYQCRQGLSQLLVIIGGREVEIVRGTASSGLLKTLMHRLAMAEPSDADTLPEALRSASEHLLEHSRLVLVSPRDIDMHDTNRFADAWDQVRMRPYLARALKIQVGSPEFKQIYQEE